MWKMNKKKIEETFHICLVGFIYVVEVCGEIIIIKKRKDICNKIQYFMVKSRKMMLFLAK